MIKRLVLMTVIIGSLLPMKTYSQKKADAAANNETEDIIKIRNRVAAKFEYYINNKLFHLLPALFDNQQAYTEFSNKLKASTIAKQDFTLRNTNTPTQRNSRLNSYSFDAGTGNTVSLKFSDANGTNQGTIQDVQWDVNNTSNAKGGNQTASPNDVTTLTYFKLSTRKDVLQTQSTEPVNMGGTVSAFGMGLELSRNVDSKSVQYTQGVNSISFPSITYNYKNLFGITKTDVFNMGNVISNGDLPQTMKDGFYGGSPLSDIYDGTTYIAYTTIWGTDYPYGCAVLLERKNHRLAFYNNGKDLIYYGNHTGEYRFTDPVAVKIISNYLYVVDAGKKKIVVFNISVQGNETTITFLSETDFGLKLDHPVDIGGVEISSAYKLMFIADGNLIYKLYLSPDGVTVDNSISAPYVIKGVTNPNNVNDFTPFSRIKRLDVSGAVTSTSYLSGFCMALTENNEVITFVANSTPNLPFSKYQPPFAFKTTFNDGFLPVNLGYHLNNNSWFVTDYTGRLHTFTEEGYYVGTNCQQGQTENSTDLLHPAAISQNYSKFRDEFVVSDEWSDNTGMKLFVPALKLSNLYVVEGNYPNTVTNDRLDFHFSLTQKPNTNISVTLTLNNKVISPSGYNYNAADHFAPSYSMDFMINELPSLVNGWNKLIVNVAGTNINETQSVDFFWLPDEVSNGFYMPVGTHNTLQPIYIYKDVKIMNGYNWMDLREGRTVIMPNCTLRVEPWNTLTLMKEEFIFTKNSALVIKNNNESRRIENCTFDGQGIATNLVQCDWNSYGLGNAFASFEFVLCNFKNYIGTALTLNSIPKVVLARTNFQLPPIDLKLNSQNQIKGVALNSVGTADIYGCTFKYNQIGIDASSTSNLNIRPDEMVSLTNLGVTNIPPSEFSNNNIGINSYSSTITSGKAKFNQNGTGIQNLSGVINLAPAPVTGSLNNDFSSNAKAIIFSGSLNMQGGYNRFLANPIEVSYIAAVNYRSASGGKGGFQVSKPTLIPAAFNWSCNNWVHGLTSTFVPPVFEIVYPMNLAPNPALYSFVYTPYATSTSGTTFACQAPPKGVINITGKMAKTDSTVTQPGDTTQFEEPTPIYVNGTTTTTSQNLEDAEKLSESTDFLGALKLLQNARMAFENYKSPTNLTAKMENKTIARRESDMAKILKQYTKCPKDTLIEVDTLQNFKNLQHFYAGKLDDSTQTDINLDEWFIQNIESLLGTGDLDSAANYLVSESIKKKLNLSLGVYDNENPLIVQAYYKNCGLTILNAIEAYADSASVKKTANAGQPVKVNTDSKMKMYDLLGVSDGLSKMNQQGNGGTKRLQNLISFDQQLLNSLWAGVRLEEIAVKDQNKDIYTKQVSLSCFPNPFGNTATLRYELIENGTYSIALYNLLGTKITNVLVNRELETGVYEQKIQLPENLSEGLYFVELVNQNKGRVKTIKVEKFKQ